MGAQDFRHGRMARDDQGSMSVELVILTPVFLLFLLLVVACGRYVDLNGELQATTRDAARAASIQRSAVLAQGAANAIVAQGLPARANCQPVQVNYQPAPAGNPGTIGSVTTSLTCTVSYDQLGLLGLPGSATLSNESTAPLDNYRRMP